MDVYNPAKNEWDKIPPMNQVKLPVLGAQAAMRQRACWGRVFYVGTACAEALGKACLLCS